MTTIRFDEADSWMALVELALEDPETYDARLRAAGIDQAYWDCSGLDDVFPEDELRGILARIEASLAGHSLQLYHGCRLYDGHAPARAACSPRPAPGLPTCCSLWRLRIRC